MRRATAGGLVNVYCEEAVMFLLDKAGGLIGIPGYCSDGHSRTWSCYPDSPTDHRAHSGESNPVLNSAQFADLIREFRAQDRRPHQCGPGKGMEHPTSRQPYSAFCFGLNKVK